MAAAFVVKVFDIQKSGVGRGATPDLSKFLIPEEKGVCVAAAYNEARTAATNVAYSWMTKTWHDMVEEQLTRWVKVPGVPEPLKLRTREELRSGREIVIVEMTEEAMIIEDRWEQVYARVELVLTTSETSV